MSSAAFAILFYAENFIEEIHKIPDEFYKSVLRMAKVIADLADNGTAGVASAVKIKISMTRSGNNFAADRADCDLSAGWMSLAP